MVTEVAARPDKRRFYEQALSAAEAADLSAAMQVEGFEEEIATLRLRLRTVLKEQPEDLALILRGMDVLRRMVATKYGLSRADQRKLSSAFAAETLRRMQERGEGGDDDGVA